MLDRPIFIIAMHRTGSTLLKNILDNNSQVSMATDEMHIVAPFGKRFYDQFTGFGSLENDKKLEEFVDFIFEGKIYGTFWKEYRELGITREQLFEKIKDTDRSLKSIVTVLLDEYRKLTNKQRVGVKYPLHFSKVFLLKEWYPDAKFVLLHRNIRAVCASKVNDEATKRRKKRFGFVAHYITLFAFIFEYIWLARYYKRNKNVFYKINYEDIVLDTEKELKDLCSYCEIPYELSMLQACGKASSHTGEIAVGVDKSRIESWKNKLTSFDRWLIEFFTKFSTKGME